jgi:hypothetical protein
MKPYRDRDWLYQKYINEKLSCSQIATLCSTWHQTISYWLKRHNIKTRGYGESNIGRTCSLETRKKIRDAQKGKKGRPITDNEKLAASKRMTVYRAQFLEPKLYHSREWLYQKYVVEKLSCYKIAKLCDDYGERVWYWIEKFGLDTRGRSEAVREHYRQNPEAAKINWANPEYVKKTLASFNIRPTRPEKIFDAMTPENICYTGDGSWWYVLPNGQHKNPDFKVKDQNKVIEIFGDYWHRNDDPQDLIDLYGAIGLGCLVIWEHEIYNDPEGVHFRAVQFTQS